MTNRATINSWTLTMTASPCAVDLPETALAIAIVNVSTTTKFMSRKAVSSTVCKRLLVHPSDVRFAICSGGGEAFKSSSVGRACAEFDPDF
jgi:hypothetical protein